MRRNTAAVAVKKASWYHPWILGRLPVAIPTSVRMTLDFGDGGTMSPTDKKMSECSHVLQ